MLMSDPIESISPEQVRAIDQFAQSAEAFCALLEQADSDISAAEFTKRCASALLTLYRDALALPAANDLPDFEEPVGEKPNPPKSIHDQVYNRFASRGLDRYSEYFDPFDADSSVTFSVSMDLVETYVDVYRGLSLYRQGGRQNILQAAWKWQFNFMHHWGPNHSGLLPVLFKIISRDENN